MLFVAVTQMYSNRWVYLCNAILVTEIFCYRCLTNNNCAKNNIFSRKFGGCFKIYWKVNVQNFTYICSGLTFLLYDVYGLLFSGHSV